MVLIIFENIPRFSFWSYIWQEKIFDLAIKIEEFTQASGLMNDICELVGEERHEYMNKFIDVAT